MEMLEMLDSNVKNTLRHKQLTLVISSLSLIGFLLIALLKKGFTTIDTSANSWSASIHTRSLTQIAEIISIGFDTVPLLAITLLIAAYLFYKNFKKNALLLVVAMIGNVAITTVVKTVVHSARPPNGLIPETGFSFPSGHVTSTVVLLGLLTYFIWLYWKSSGAKALTSMVFVGVAFLVGFSRLYLNVHWLSDVLGGYLMGVFWFTFSISAFQYLETTVRFQMK
jgi:undecaprenyl-diphosphatase